jgi:hypothetical protein
MSSRERRLLNKTNTLKMCRSQATQNQLTQKVIFSIGTHNGLEDFPQRIGQLLLVPLRVYSNFVCYIRTMDPRSFEKIIDKLSLRYKFNFTCS